MPTTGSEAPGWKPGHTRSDTILLEQTLEQELRNDLDQALELFTVPTPTAPAWSATSQPYASTLPTPRPVARAVREDRMDEWADDNQDLLPPDVDH